MTILFLALAYLVGITFGRLFWDTGWIGCNFPDWLWWVTLALLPLTPLLNRLPLQSISSIPLRWPQSAGFVLPRPVVTPALATALALCLCTGLFRYASAPLTPCWTSNDLAAYNLPADRAFDQDAPQVTLYGYVSSYPLVADREQRMHVVVTQLDGLEAGQTVAGELRLTTGLRQRYLYGQPIRLHGRLVTPPDFEDFSYREFLARKGVHSLLYSAQIETLDGPNLGHPLTRLLYALRAKGERLLNHYLPEPYAALANGMLLGIESGIPDQLYDKFNLTGSSHVIVISGSNVALIAAVILGLSQRLLGQRRALWPTLAGIVCYALLVGGDAAVLRAACMGSLYVVATTLGRRSTALVSLAAACWLMTLINPLTLWDVGFQLSSGATAGLILFSTGVTEIFGKLWPGIKVGPSTGPVQLSAASLMDAAKRMCGGLVQDGLFVTIAANISTLPLVVYYFGRLSLVSLLTNFLILPVQPMIMLGGSAAVVVGVAGLGWLAGILLWLPWLGLVWTVTMVQWTAALPGASLAIVGYGSGALVFTYLIIFAVHWRSHLLVSWQNWWRGQIGNWQRRIIGQTAVSGLAVGAILIWSLALSQPDGRLHLYFLDIGQGDGVLIQTPSGRQVLIDGGASPQLLFNQLGAVMPFWDRSLDIIAMTNPDKDHMGAQTEAPARLDITTALETAASQVNTDADAWRATLTAAGVDVRVQQDGGWVDLGDGVALWVLWPPAEIFMRGGASNEQLIDNENSLVMKLVYGDFSVLLTGDAGLPAEMALLAAGAPVQSTVLKVGHHGSKGSSSHTFVQAVNPQIAVIQSGADNSYGHPHPETLANLTGQLVLRNDLHGRVHIYSDGQQMWLETEKGQPIP